MLCKCHRSRYVSTPIYEKSHSRDIAFSRTILRNALAHQAESIARPPHILLYVAYFTYRMHKALELRSEVKLAQSPSFPPQASSFCCVHGKPFLVLMFAILDSYVYRLAASPFLPSL